MKEVFLFSEHQGEVSQVVDIAKLLSADYVSRNTIIIERDTQINPYAGTIISLEVRLLVEGIRMVIRVATQIDQQARMELMIPRSKKRCLYSSQLHNYMIENLSKGIPSEQTISHIVEVIYSALST